MWMVFMLLAFFILCFLTFETTSKFLDEKIVLQLSSREVSISEIPFPAVTICPQFINKNLFQQADLDLFDPLNDK
jgi:Amiloride-sensitive sodium channel